MAKLQVIFAGQIKQEYDLTKEDCHIGRKSSNEICIDNRGVSGQHALVSFENDHYILKDMDSTNGTKLNGKKISTAVLKHGDKINLFKHTINFVWLSAEHGAEQSQQQTTVPSHTSSTVDPDATVMLDGATLNNMQANSSHSVQGANNTGAKKTNDESFKQPMLEVTSADEIKKIILSNKSIIIGKKASCDIHTGGWLFTPAISAVIKKDMSGMYTIKPETTIALNGKKTKEKQILKNGDRILIKNTVINVML